MHNPGATTNWQKPTGLQHTRVGGGGWGAQSEPAAPTSHAGWMVCGQQTLLRCIPVPFSTMVVSLCTNHPHVYVCTYLPTYLNNHHQMPYRLPYTQQHKNHLHFPTYLPTYGESNPLTFSTYLTHLHNWVGYQGSSSSVRGDVGRFIGFIYPR